MIETVFSTSVEVFLRLNSYKTDNPSLLHVRGGVSIYRASFLFALGSSPRPWRCFRLSRDGASDAVVFSTSVEVFPDHDSSDTVCASSSPRPWRCFFIVISCSRLICSLLHVRGGVSNDTPTSEGVPGSSPRPWRCFRQNSGSRSP